MTRRRPIPPIGESKRGEILLGDLAWALQTLGIDDKQHALAITRCLGFGGHLADPGAQQQAEVSDARHDVAPRTTRTSPSAPSPGGATRPPPQPQIPLPSQNMDAQLRRVDQLAPRAHTRPDWLDEAPTNISVSDELPVARQTLFPEVGSRHILSASLSTLRLGTQIDIPALIERQVRMQTLIELPRLAETTLDRGCQLLLDYSDSMIPFRDDLAALTRQVVSVAGEANVEIFRFEEDPVGARRWSAQRRRLPWAPRQRPVLVATGFGRLGTEPAATLTPEWQSFADRCREEGSPLLILVPWPRIRWPRFPRAYPTLIHWNESTTVAMVLNKILAKRALPK